MVRKVNEKKLVDSEFEIRFLGFAEKYEEIFERYRKRGYPGLQRGKRPW